MQCMQQRRQHQMRNGQNAPPFLATKKVTFIRQQLDMSCITFNNIIVLLNSFSIKKISSNFKV
jgi:hypothetical protein